MKIKVSVILPFFNAESTLSRAIKSITSQTFQELELILIDNNSSDNSRAIAIEEQKKDTRITIIEEKRQGVMFASNAGSEIAKGEYITRMDADDWSYPKRIIKMVNFLTTNPDYDVVAGLVEHIGDPVASMGLSRYVDWSNSLQTFDQILANQFVESPIINPSAMWRKETAIKFGMYKYGDFPEDYEMWLRWLNKGVRMAKIPDHVLKWYDSETRLTRTHKIYRDKAFYKIKSKYLAEWLKKHNPHYPKVVVWGASKISRRRARILTNHNIEISCYIDITRKRRIHDDIIYYQNIPSSEEIFVLVYIKQADARKEIQDFLLSRNFIEGKHYLLVS